jgi:hypothetical protein
MNFFKYAKKRRAYDGKWEVLGLYRDEEDTYRFKDEEGRDKMVPAYKWVTVRVEDMEPGDIRNG